MHKSQEIAMLFGKLLPKEGNFFEMFNQHADRIVEAAHAFSNWWPTTATRMLREQVQPGRGQRRARGRPRDARGQQGCHKTFITPIDREQIHG
jgi:uncharacterized protein Yka (UPF0111/DUF47 family)